MRKVLILSILIIKSIFLIGQDQQGLAEAMCLTIDADINELKYDLGEKWEFTTVDKSRNVYSFLLRSEKLAVTIWSGVLVIYMMSDNKYKTNLSALLSDDNVRVSNKNEMSSSAKKYLETLSPKNEYQYFKYKNKYSVMVVRRCEDGYSSCNNNIIFAK